MTREGSMESWDWARERGIRLSALAYSSSFGTRSRPVEAECTTWGFPLGNRRNDGGFIVSNRDDNTTAYRLSAPCYRQNSPNQCPCNRHRHPCYQRHWARRRCDPGQVAWGVCRSSLIQAAVQAAKQKSSREPEVL